jgi:hypothetical protein
MPFVVAEVRADALDDLVGEGRLHDEALVDLELRAQVGELLFGVAGDEERRGAGDGAHRD